MMWGPFADPSDRLTFMVTGNCHKSKKQSRAAMRKQEMDKKQNERHNDEANIRGYSNDQIIELKMLDLNRKREATLEREVMVTGLAVEEEVLSKQLDCAERMASCQCPEYDPDNRWWEKLLSLGKNWNV